MRSKIQYLFQNYEVNGKLSIDQLHAINDIKRCRTKEMGGHVYTCTNCGDKQISYNSCRNRHCPICENYKKEVWVRNQNGKVVNTKYYHIVLTIPKELYPIFYQNKKECYDLLFEASSRTLLELSKEKLHAEVGLMQILHTWTQVGDYHPHIHAVITNGGVTRSNKWFEGNTLDIKIVEKVYKRKLLKLLKKSKLTFYNKYEFLNNKDNLISYLDNLYEKDWVVYIKEKDIKDIYEYLGRYIYKVFITDERITKIEKNKVTIKYYERETNTEKEKTFKIEEFLRRYVMHVLPKNYMKIRYYGIYGIRDRDKRIHLVKQITHTIEINILDKMSILNEINKRDLRECPKCGCKYLKKDDLRQSKKCLKEAFG